MMDTQYLFNVAVSIAGFLGGWVLNNIYQTLRVLDKLSMLAFYHHQGLPRLHWSRGLQQTCPTFYTILE